MGCFDIRRICKGQSSLVKIRADKTSSLGGWAAERAWALGTRYQAALASIIRAPYSPESREPESLLLSNSGSWNSGANMCKLLQGMSIAQIQFEYHYVAKSTCHCKWANARLTFTKVFTEKWNGLGGGKIPSLQISFLLSFPSCLFFLLLSPAASPALFFFFFLSLSFTSTSWEHFNFRKKCYIGQSYVIRRRVECGRGGSEEVYKHLPNSQSKELALKTILQKQ